MGSRKDLEHGLKELEDLSDRWQERRLDLEEKLDESWARLRSMRVQDDNVEEKDAQRVYEEIMRLDRSLSFLDRALMHLDDIEWNQEQARGVPLRPGSTPKEKLAPEGSPDKGGG